MSAAVSSLPIELEPHRSAIQLVYDAAAYVGQIAYAGGEEHLFKNALEAELKARFQEWSIQTKQPAPYLQMEAVLSYQYPVSIRETAAVPPCAPPGTHLRADIWVYSSSPDFPSMVIELKSVDKMLKKHRRQAHQYFSIMKHMNGMDPCYKPKLALVINFRAFFYKENYTMSPATSAVEEIESEHVDVPKKRRKSKESDATIKPEFEITQIFVSSMKTSVSSSPAVRSVRTLEESDNSDTAIQFAAGVEVPSDPALSTCLEEIAWWGITASPSK